jgi:hypothetical protein
MADNVVNPEPGGYIACLSTPEPVIFPNVKSGAAIKEALQPPDD